MSRESFPGAVRHGVGSTAFKGVKRFLCIVICLLCPSVAFGAFGLTSSGGYYTVDTEAGLVFKVNQSNGDITSLVYNGTEYQYSAKGTHINSGLGTSGVSVAGTLVGTDAIKITVTAPANSAGGVLTHYYMAHRGNSHIYMATHFTQEPDIGLVRFIVRIPNALLPNGPVPSDIRNTDNTVESGDIFSFSSANTNTALIGQTRSKHYSGQRLKDWSYTGATGTGVAAWMVRGHHEGGSGGPFYRSLINQCGDQQELYEIINYGEAQTEPFRYNILNGPYTLVFTTGGPPPAFDLSWVAGMGLAGYMATTDRGTVTCAGISNRDTSYGYTVGFANSTAQYWTNAAAASGAFTKSDMLPGTYTMSVYKNELVVHSAAVAVTAGVITVVDPITIAADPSGTVPLWRIGNWDGTPAEFLNGGKVTSMHPSDVRISGWNPGTYVVGSSSPATGMPCYQWKDIAGGSQTIQFTLTAGQIAASTIKVGITCANAGARPNIGVNSWTSGLQGASTQPTSRTLTVGTYRGNNVTYTFSVPASALVVGTNSLYLYPISGSSSTSPYLSPGYSLDCVELYQGTAQVLAVADPPAAVTANSGDTQVALSWAAASGAASYKVLRATTSGGPYTTVAAALNATSFIDTGLTNGVMYYYMVSSNNSSGTGIASDEVSALPVTAAAPATPTSLTAIPYNASTALTWNPSFGATSYKVKRSTTNGSGYQVIKTTATANYSDFGLANGSTYYYVVSAVNSYGESPDSSQVSVTPGNGTTIILTSTAALDGYVTASGSTNTTGGTITTTGTVRTGDSNNKRQYKGVFSFDTSSIPDEANLQSVTLKIRRSTLAGTSPFTAFGSCYADIKGGTGFNGSTALENADFEAAADGFQVATMSNAPTDAAVSTGALNPSGVGLINKTGATQFRVYFSSATNNNTTGDYISWYAGDEAVSANRPVLEVTYATAMTPSSLPVVRLPFDETSGSTASDATGNGWTGTLFNGPAWVAGRVNNAVSLTATNHYVAMPPGVLAGLNDFTISAWVNPATVTNWSRIFDFGTGTGNYLFLAPANSVTGKLRFAIRTATVAEQLIDGTAPLSAGAWAHVAVTLSGSTGKLYLNGALVGTNASMTLKPSSLGSTSQNYLGKSQFTADPNFNGLIDEFQIFNHALTAPEVALLAAPPAAPAGLVATPGDGQATLAWNTVPGTVSGYNLKRATAAAGPYAIIASGIPQSGYIDSALTNGTSYYYMVCAFNGVGEGGNSAQVNVIPMGVPANVAATTFNSAVALSWSPATGAASYTVKRSAVAGGPYAALASGVTATTFSDTTSAAGTTYYYVISAVNGTGESANSIQVAIMASPVAPTSLAAAAGNATVTLTWNSAAGAGTYNLLRSGTTGAGFTGLATGITGTSYNDNSAVNGVTYYYVVSAQNAGGESAWSAEASATPSSTASVTLGNLAANYDGNPKPASVATSPPGLSVIVTYDSSSSVPADPGTYAVVATISDPNYSGSASGNLVITRVPISIVWTGASDFTWNAATRNWSSAGAAVFYQPGDTVAFTDAGNANAPVVLAANVQPAAIAVNASKNYTISGTGVITGSSTLAKSGTGILIVNTAHTFTGATTISGGILQVGDGGTAGSLAATSGITNNATLAFNRSNALTVATAVGGSGGVVKSGVGDLILTGANNYTGGTIVNAGKLSVGSGSTTSGLAPNALVLAGGTHFRLNSSTAQTSSNAISISGVNANVTVSVGSISSGFNGTISGTADQTLSASGTTQMSFGASTQQLAGFAGTVDIPVGSTIRFSTTSTTSNVGGAGTSFNVNGYLTARNAIGGTGGIHLGALAGSGTILGGGSTAAGTDIWIVGEKNLGTTFAGLIANGSGASLSLSALTKLGSGVLTLSGSNAYTGATLVSSGKLLVTGSLAATPVAVATSGVLGGTGSIGGAVTCNGALEPGVTAGNLTLLGGLSLATTSTLNYDLGTTSDLVSVSGSVTLDGKINVTAGAGFGAGGYTLISYGGSLTNNTLEIGNLPVGYTAVVDVATPGLIKLVVSGTRSFQNWQTSNFTSAQTAAGLSAATADPDQDSLTNLGEYALGTAPLGFTKLPDSVRSATSLSITFQRPAALLDVTYKAEVCSDLIHWTPVALEVLNPGGDPESVRATYILPVPVPRISLLRLRFEK